MNTFARPFARLFLIPLAALSLAAVSACGQAEDIDDDDLQSDCGSDDARVGTTAELQGYFHDVAGTVEVIDNCTLRINNFTFDGGGLDVRIFGSADGDFENGVSLTNDLRQSEGYDNEELEFTLPNGITLDDVGQLSVWCVTAGENFGDADLF